MSDFPEFSSMFPSYLSSAVEYFKAPRPRARQCAVRLASSLAQRLDPAGVAKVDADSVCGGLAALLALDKDVGVKEAAAAAIGTTFSCLKIGVIGNSDAED